ncbi:MAG: metal-dependent hydrolase [Leptospiraceae bacterium]|nr:metal-dependent hydrolase [Leptospiraceae bacterium]MCP5493713.1 metal-dependent hydrolase [Leptospiraceae bacterium]
MSNRNNIQYMPVVRKPQFNWEEISSHWCDNNFFATHFVNSMHVVFPEGEKFFIRSVKAFADRIKDKELQERVKLFIGQETQHMMQHKNFWEVLQKQSPALDMFHKLYTNMAYGRDEAKWSIDRKKLALSTTVALEHYTAIMAEVALEKESKLLEGIPEEMTRMLQWHAAEEIEHKSVAFDVLKEVDDSYLLRIKGMILASLDLTFYVGMGQIIFMSQDKTIKLEELPSHLFRFIKKTTPIFKGILANVADYFRPDFHPNDNDNLFMAEQIFQKIMTEKAVA